MPEVDSVLLTRQVVAERAGGTNVAYFNALQDEWCQRIQQYIDSGGCPPTVTTWDAAQAKKGAFLNLYLAPAEGSAQGQMLRALRQHELTQCPACGELGRPNTLDHYLPKTLYPHFCVTPVNLFPMCDACQQAKGTRVGNAITPRFFIHPYFDTFVAEQVLRLAIHAPFAAPTFTLEITEGLAPEQAQLVRSHLRELKIQERYANFFRNQHRRLLRLVSRAREGAQDVGKTLALFKEGAIDPSPNAWDHVFYSAVVDNQALVDYLTNGELPDYL